MNAVQKLIDNKIDFCIIGGYCRYLLGIEKEFKDIDIVTNTDADLWKLFPEAKKNPYDGLELPGFNIWDIKNNVIPSKSFEELYDNYFITYDAIMYHPYTNTWYIYNYKPYVEINLNVLKYQKHKLNVEKIGRLRQKGLKLSHNANLYVITHDIIGAH